MSCFRAKNKEVEFIKYFVESLAIFLSILEFIVFTDVVVITPKCVSH